MTNDNFTMLCADLEQIADQVFNDPETPCDFSDDNQDVVEFEAEFNIFEGRD